MSCCSGNINYLVAKIGACGGYETQDNDAIVGAKTWPRWIHDLRADGRKARRGAVGGAAARASR